MAVCCSVLHCNKLRMSTWFPTKANYYTTQEKCIFCSSPSLTARTRSWSACNLSASSSQGNMRWASQKNEHSSLVSRWWRRSCSRHDERRRYSERNARWHDGMQSCQCPCFSPYWVYTHTHNCTCCSLILHQTDTMGQRVISLFAETIARVLKSHWDRRQAKKWSNLFRLDWVIASSKVNLNSLVTLHARDQSIWNEVSLSENHFTFLLINCSLITQKWNIEKQLIQHILSY